MDKGILWGYFPSGVNVKRRYPCGQPHHITLRYGVAYQDYRDLIGKQFQAIATHLCWNDRTEAIAVQLPEWVPCSIVYPHITVSWVDGAKPIEANEMLATKYSCIRFEQSIDVAIDFLNWE
ncbi:hypothetical protein FD723_40230 (plasmid) [Nostoc sp. C052]|uniref:hypothetical protein n=1 Tax=Nostoc sp. C052 TaxID=2576902 RepID=UPI0015C3C55C|nr:hypothetical protein [Nostoc sp. C052]QLE46442.1 hypothetical protein FD723_40230 [Nostoc sp. C052]